MRCCGVKVSQVAKKGVPPMVNASGRFGERNECYGYHHGANEEKIFESKNMIPIAVQNGNWHIEKKYYVKAWVREGRLKVMQASHNLEKEGGSMGLKNIENNYIA